MSDPGKSPEPVDAAPDVPLDQTTPPIDQLQEGLIDNVPLDQTRAETREILGSEGVPSPRPHRRS
jgi:hypothetical protein